MYRGLAAALGILFLLAGCTQPAEPVQESSTEERLPEDELGERFDARPIPTGTDAPQPRAEDAAESERPGNASAAEQVATYTKDDWFLLPVRAAPEGGLASFAFTVPNGSAARDPTEPGTGMWGFWLEVAPRFGQDFEAWVFAIIQDDWPWATTHASTRMSVTSTAPESSRSEPVATRPFKVGVPGMSDGATIHIVVGVAGPDSQTGFMFRILHGGMPRPTVAESQEEFVTRLSGEGQVLPAGATATGFQIAYFEEVLQPTGATRATSDAVALQDGSLDAADTRRRAITVSASRPSPTGFTTGHGEYVASTAVGTWEVKAESRGVGGRSAGTLARALVVSAPTPATGAPWFAIIADGEGGSQVRMTVDALEYSMNVVMRFWVLDLDASIESLTGTTLQDAFWGMPGMVSLPEDEAPDAEGPRSSVGNRMHMHRAVAVPG